MPPARAQHQGLHALGINTKRLSHSNGKYMYDLFSLVASSFSLVPLFRSKHPFIHPTRRHFFSGPDENAHDT